MLHVKQNGIFQEIPVWIKWIKILIKHTFKLEKQQKMHLVIILILVYISPE